MKSSVDALAVTKETHLSDAPRNPTIPAILARVDQIHTAQLPTTTRRNALACHSSSVTPTAMTAATQSACATPIVPRPKCASTLNVKMPV